MMKITVAPARLTAPLVVAVCLILAGVASAAVYKRIGSASASGDFATTIASGTAKRPIAIYVAVFATPRQKVDVNWTLVCSKGLGAGSKSGHFTTTSSAKRKLRLPTAHPDECQVSAGGSLDRGGHIVVRLYQR